MSEVRDADGRIIEDETPDSVGAKESEQTGLAPCPFCGATSIDIENNKSGNEWGFCETCSAEGPVAKSYTEAIEKWNKRVPLISTPSQSATATVREQKESVWIKTSERAPTEKDSDWGGNVFAITEDHIPELVDVDSVASTPYLWPYWMPIPALPVPES